MPANEAMPSPWQAARPDEVPAALRLSRRVLAQQVAPPVIELSSGDEDDTPPAPALAPGLAPAPVMAREQTQAVPETSTAAAESGATEAAAAAAAEVKAAAEKAAAAEKKAEKKAVKKAAAEVKAAAAAEIRMAYTLWAAQPITAGAAEMEPLSSRLRSAIAAASACGVAADLVESLSLSMDKSEESRAVEKAEAEAEAEAEAAAAAAAAAAGNGERAGWWTTLTRRYRGVIRFARELDRHAHTSHALLLGGETTPSRQRTLPLSTPWPVPQAIRSERAAGECDGRDVGRTA